MILYCAPPLVGSVWRRIVVQFSVKDKRITGAQRNGNGGFQRLRRYQSVFIPKPGMFRDTVCMRSWDNVHATVFDGSIIACHPEAKHMVWHKAKIGVVLMPNLFAAQSEEVS